MSLKYKLFFVLMCCLLPVIQVGCTSNDFGVIAPPLNVFPTPENETYEEVTVIVGDFVEKKSMRIDKESNLIFVPTNAQSTNDFSVGETGIISYESTYGSDANVEGEIKLSGDRVIVEAISNKLKYIGSGISGNFSVIINKEENCTLIDKNAVLLSKDGTFGIVYKIDADGILQENEVIIEGSNDTYYKVSGITAGEKVVKLK